MFEKQKEGAAVSGLEMYGYQTVQEPWRRPTC